jgi:hypothetical protein
VLVQSYAIGYLIVAINDNAHGLLRNELVQAQGDHGWTYFHLPYGSADFAYPGNIFWKGFGN